ncbi:uncharacterized protein [Primulina eburnea]|uniref:uncharacterized protein n=1 Tax=Primulina eburnea TaxID=1245227 RepID=UPI003C6C51A9
MTAEAEVCNGAVSEVAGIEEKSEFKARSFQDLAKPELNGIGNHDKTHDPEDSYVLVTDVGDPCADGKDVAAVDGSPRHESSAPVEPLGIELDAWSRNPDGVSAEKHGNAEGGDESFTLVNGSTDVQSISLVEGGGDQDTVKEDKCLEELSDQNGKINVVNGEEDPTLTEGGIGNAASADENSSVANGVVVRVEGSVRDEDEIQDKLVVHKPACEAESEINKAEDSNGKVEKRSEEAEVVKFEDQNGKIGVVAEAEPDKVEDRLISEANQESEVPNLGMVADSGEEEVLKNLLSPSDKQKTVEDEVESALGQEAMQGEKCDQESEVPNLGMVADSGEEEEPKNLSLPSDKEETVEDEVESALGQEAMQGEKCDQESEVPNLGMVADSGEEEEPKNLSLPSDKEETVEDEVESALGQEAMQGEKCDQESEVPNLGMVADSGEEEEPKNLSSPTDKEETVEDEVESALGQEAMQDTKCDQESEVRNLGMVADSGEEEEPKNLSSPSDKEDTVEDEVESSLGKEAMQEEKCDIDPENDIQYCLDTDKVVQSNVVSEIGTSCDEVLEVEGNIIYPDDVVNCRDETGSTPLGVSERETGASGEIQKISASSAQIQRPANEVQISDAETDGVIISSLPSDGSESENFGNEPINLDSLETCSVDGVCSGSDIRMVVSNGMEPISQGSELTADFKDDHNPPVSAVKLEPEAHNSSGADHVVVTSEKDATSGLEVIDSFVSDKGDDWSLLAKNAGTGNSCSVDISMASAESGSDTVTEKDVSGVAVTKPFNFFVRTPRYSDEKLQEQIRIAELEVNEKTKLRDSIQAQIQEKRAKNQNNGIDYEYAKGEDRSIKKLIKEKRVEIDSLQSVINKAKNATSIEDLNSRIKTVEHMIQHETLPLKEEKLFIHEIKQLKQLREQLSSSNCSQSEIQQALEQREQAEERLKTLRKELSNLKYTASKAQTACDEAEGKYNVEHKKVKELQAHFRAADDVRQEAYAKFLSLSKELSQKRRNFFKFKNDSATATYNPFTDDKKNLYQRCVNEVENFMELWNGNNEFRSEYVRLNTRSTLRRFGTLDGRSLGPDEKPPILPSYVRERNDKAVSVPANADSISKSSPMELKPEANIENANSDIHSIKKETESKEKTATTRGPAKSKQVNSLATVSGMDEEKVEVQEELIKTKEELELIRKAEEIRREKTEANLKEQRRLEEIAKAKEARERKQRRDEKAQKREELKARKEAEQKEKEREKKSRKNERRKAGASSISASTDLQDDASSITCVEISKEEASTQVNDVSIKKPKTSRVMVSKQKQTRSTLPPSLRNRNRRKWQQWMWVSLVSLVVLVLFLLGNMGVFSSVNSKLRGSGF